MDRTTSIALGGEHGVPPSVRDEATPSAVPPLPAVANGQDTESAGGELRKRRRRGRRGGRGRRKHGEGEAIAVSAGADAAEAPAAKAPAAPAPVIAKTVEAPAPRVEAPREREPQKQQNKPRPPQQEAQRPQRDERRNGRDGRDRDRGQRPGDSRGGSYASPQQNRTDRSRFRRSNNKPEEPRRPGEAVASSAIWAGWSAARFGGGSGDRD